MTTLDRKTLLAALDTLKTITPKATRMPALAHVGIKVTPGAVHLMATDLYRTAWLTLPGDGSDTWRRAIDLRTTIDCLKRMTGHTATLAANDGLGVAMAEASRRFTIAGMDPEDMPPLPSEQKAVSLFSIRADALVDGLDRVLYAVSTDETRAHLNALLVEVQDGSIKLVATDGHRIAFRVVEAATEGRAPAVPLLLTRDAALTLRNACKRAKDATVLVGADDKTAFVRVGMVSMAFRIVDAPFPPYGQVVPTAWTHRVDASREALLAACKACNIASNACVKLSLDGRTLVVRGEASGSSATETIAVTRKGEPGSYTIGVSADYLAESVATVEGDTVRLSFQDPLAPIVVRDPGHSDHSEPVAVVMPMRI